MKIDRKNKFYSYFESLSIIFLSLTILPFIILSIYTNPSWDDFQFAAMTTQHGMWGSQYMWYNSWTGTFFSIAVLSVLNPLIFKSILGYKILPLILIVCTIVSSYFLIREITSRSVSRKELLLCSLVFCSLYFFKMANVAFGFYWMAASVKYQLANIIMVILFTLIIMFFKEENPHKKSLLRILIFILIFATAGSSEISMFILLMLLFLIFGINFLVERKINWQLFYFLIASVIASGIVYLSPGNAFRSKDYPRSHQLVSSIINGSTDLVKFISYRIVDTPLLLFTILFIPFCIKIISSKKINLNFLYINPVYSIISLLIVMLGGFFTTYWSLGEGPYDRTVNVVYFIFLIGWFLNILIVVNYLQNKFDFKFYALPKYALVIICIVIALSFRRENNIKNAYKDLAYGTAFRFDEELRNRYNKLYEDESDVCELDSLKAPIPSSFFYYDVGSDAEMKYNKYLASYFNKKSIVVKRNVSDSVKNNQ